MVKCVYTRGVNSLMKITQAIILAGGKGERLLPLTKDKPKPMVDVLGRPFISYLIDNLKDNGIEEVVLLTGYLHEKLEDYLGDGDKFGIRVKYSHGKLEDDTAVRLKNARSLLNENFLLVYGDNYWPMSLQKMTDFYESKNVLASVTVYKNTDSGSEYGPESEIKVSGEGMVEVYDRERKSNGLQGVIIGFYLMNKKAIDFIPEGNAHIERDLIPRLIEQGKLAAFRTDHPYYPITNIQWLKHAENFFKLKKVIFLDRDGVINKKIENNYVKSWKEFEFLPGSIEALAHLTFRGFDIFIITNQRGVALGTMTDQNLSDIHNNMKERLASAGVSIKGIYHCPHDKGVCDCRKPKAGMLYRAARDHYLDLTKVIFIGDSESDIIAGKAAGCRTILLKSGESLLDIAKSLV